ncbi:FAD/FMN-binding family oxidoreductase (macronuclear) [Tetrahymena thermophila SB210]|uniref:FAD/FMN-binding family oxidoreductase n=1 Tax=Tetrahymena thermophila (strain SB210) TaxID=312017 RepID=Q231Q6_TETTS|nr:FAD/FMN-binding family oxidoreductase [Tetrahymena thermophila SB210]EAR91246.2 FAD/FMN-binding family oxidoreductase [Tetrahymena thermophila SB210]|eukprot:XP_001011491.2 FAD/FMN-binding family oxidoreductase [Tetrahymena thermophila SB210]
MYQLELSQVASDKYVGRTNLNQIFESLPFNYEISYKDLKDMQEKMQYYICSQNHIVLNKDNPQICLIVVLKGKLQVKPAQSTKVGRIYEAGSSFGLVQFARQTGVAKTLVALEESIIAKIDIQNQEQAILGQKIIDLIQKCVCALRDLSFFSLLSEQNILRIIASSKIFNYMHQEEFKCSFENYMIVLQGKFQRILYFEEETLKISDKKSKISFPKLQSNQGISTSQEYNHGDVIATNHQQEIFKFNNVNSENDYQDQFESKQQPQIESFNNCLFQCKSESGILLQIQKTLFSKFIQFYQGIQNNKQRRQINIGQITANNDSQTLSRDRQIYKAKNNMTDTSAKNFVKSIFINQKPETSSGRIQNFQVPKVDFDLFTRRSNVSPDQKQEFYECYSSRNESAIKKQILRNFSELTSRKSKNQLFAQPNSNNYMNNDHYNLFQNFSDDTAKVYMKQKQFQNFNLAQSTQSDEFQTVLRMNQIMKTDNESDSKDYYLKVQQNNQNILKQENNNKAFTYEKDHQSEYNFHNLQQNFQKGKSLIYKSLQSLSERKQNSSVNQLLQQKPLNFPQTQFSQQKQQLQYQQLLQKQQKNDPNNTVKSQMQSQITSSKYLKCQPYQLNQNPFNQQFIDQQSHVIFPQKLSSGQTIQPKDQSRKQSVIDNQKDANLLTLNPLQSLNPEQKKLWEQKIKEIKKSKGKNNSIQIEQNQINNQENQVIRSRNLSRLKTEENDDSFKFIQKSTNDLTKEQIFSLYNLNDPNNITATFTKLQNTSSMNKLQIQKIKQKIQNKIISQDQQHHNDKHTFNQNILIEENPDQQETQQQNLFTFYKNKSNSSGQN